MANASGTNKGGESYDYVQSSQPSNPSGGDTWLDTSSGNGTSKIYADFGNGLEWKIMPVQNELESGETRSLLESINQGSISDVENLPVNVQTALSFGYTTDGNGDYEIAAQSTTTATRPTDGGVGTYGGSTRLGVVFVPNVTATEVSATISDESGGKFSNAEIFKLSNNSVVASQSLSTPSADTTVSFSGLSLTAGDQYAFATSSYNEIGTKNSSQTVETGNVDLDGGYDDGSIVTSYYGFNDIAVTGSPTTANVTDSYTPPALTQWVFLEVIDTTVGGSTSPTPLEVELLDDIDNVINSTRIPKSEIGDTKFRLRDRSATVTASSNGQSNYTIPNTGSGGRYGIPIFEVITVKLNGAIIDDSNWSFDGTDTVTIDTNNVTISNGDSITITYDFDVFNSPLQVKTYLNRADNTETSPTFSHLRYAFEK